MNFKSKEFQLLISDIEFRSERRDKYLPIYEDLGYLVKLDNNKNQVVFGRRGSGKTHLLGSLVEFINKERENIAVYIDLRTVVNDIIVDDVLNVDEKSFIYFWKCITEIIIRLREEVMERLESPKLSKSIREKLIESITLIDQLLKDISSQKFDKVVGEFSADDLSDPEFGFVKTGAKKEVSKKGLKEGFIKDRIESIVKNIGADYLIVGFDEWPRLMRAIQPRLANMLNKAFFSSKRIVFKFATIRFRTQIYIAKDGVGLELGADTSDDIDLDILQMWERGLEASKGFFVRMLAKHLNFSIKKLNLDFNNFTNKNIMKLFASDRTFIELVKASEGIPRDFLNVFKRSYDYFVNDTVAKGISIRHIKKAVSDWYQDDKISVLDPPSRAYQLLERLINEVITKYKTKQFILLSKESANKDIQKLVDLRLLHLLRRGWSSKKAPGERYDVFSIDYGAFISILETKIGKEVQQIWTGDEPLPEINLRAIRRREFSIKESQIKSASKKIKVDSRLQPSLPLFDLKNKP